MPVAAPARQSAPATKPRVPARRPASPARRPQPRTRPRPQAPGRSGRASSGRTAAQTVGRTAGAVRHLPDSGLVKGLTRGRVWIPVIGILLAGIVAVNIWTLSMSAASGKAAQTTSELARENSVMRTQLAERLSNTRVQAEAASLGMVAPGARDFNYRDADAAVITEAARRLSATTLTESG